MSAAVDSKCNRRFVLSVLQEHVLSDRLLHFLYLNARKRILIACDSQECVKIQEAGWDCQWESLFSSANMNVFAKISEDRKMI